MTSPASSRLSADRVWRYALPAIPMALPTLAVYIWLPSFYAEQTALSLTTVGAVLLLARVFDLLSDLYAGRWCDRRFRWMGRLGKRRGWMLLGYLLAAPALISILNPATNISAWQLLLGCIVLYTGWTLIQVPWQAWLVELSGDGQQRLHLAGRREILGLVGLLLSAAIPVIVIESGGTLAQGLSLLGWVAVVLGLPCAWLLRALPEPPGAQVSEQVVAWQQLRQLLANRLWLRMLLAWGLNTLANGTAAVLFPLAIAYGFGGSDQARVWLLLVYFGSAVVALPWVLRCRIERHRLWCGSMLIASLAFAITPLLSADQLFLFGLVCAVTGALLGADLALPPTLQGDVIDWDRWRYRRDWPAACYAGHSLVMKLALGIAAALAPALLELNGWQLETAGVDTRFELLVIYAWLPCVLKLAAVVVLWRFPLTAKHQRALARRLASRALNDGAQQLGRNR